MADPYAGWTMRQGTDGTWYEVPPAERAPVANALMAARDRIPENPNTGWSASNMLRGALERSANLQDTVAGYRDPKTADPLDLVPMLAPGAIAGTMRGPARSTLMSAGGVPPKDAPGFTAYHGSPHEFDRFSMDKIGTGEGAQAYGHGLYFADREGVARSYRDKLKQTTVDGSPYSSRTPEGIAAQAAEFTKGDMTAARKYLTDNIEYAGHPPELRDLHRRALDLIDTRGFPNVQRDPGHMYEVRIKADPADFLDWDKPISQQSEFVRSRVGDAAERQRLMLEARERRYASGGSYTPRTFTDAGSLLGDLAHTGELQALGIPGIRYDDAMSRGASGGTRNTVVFDDKLIEIIRKYGLAAALMGGGAAAMGGPSSPAAASEAAPAPRNMLRP